MCALLLLWLAAGAGCPAPVGKPPEPDLSSADPEVVDLVTRTLDDVREAPRDAAVRVRLGLVYEANGLVRAAGECYEQATRLDPDDPRAWYHAAIVRNRVGDADGAMEALDRAIELDASYAPARWRRGEWLLDSGGPPAALQAAEADFRRVIEADGGDPAGWAGLARVMLRDGREPEAVSILERLVGEQPHNAYLHYLLGTAYRETGQPDRARAELKLGRGARQPWRDPWNDAVNEFHVGFSASIERAKGMIATSRYDEAITLLTTLRQRRPDSLPVLNNLSVALLRTGQVDEALEILLKVNTVHPEYFPAQLNLSGAYERKGDLPQALEHVERAIAINPTLGQAHERRGVILLRMRRIEPALDALATSIEYEPDDAHVQMLAGVAAGELGRWPEALGYLEQSCRLNPQDFQAQLALGYAAVETRDLDRARTALEQVRALSPQHPKVLELQNRIEQAEGAR